MSINETNENKQMTETNDYLSNEIIQPQQVTRITSALSKHTLRLTKMYTQ